MKPSIANLRGLMPKLSFRTLCVMTALIGALASTGYVVWRNSQIQGELARLKRDPQAAARDEMQALVREVASVIELPQGEDPTIATVTDKEKLKDQPFFKNVENGDKALIYAQAKKIILYRPSTHKVIDVGPVNIGSEAVAGTATPAAQLKVTLYNGTTKVGATGTIEDQLKKSFSDLVLEKEQAKKREYDKTIVVDISGKQKDLAREIGTLLKAQVGALPAGETAPNADILVIVGKDALK